MEPSLPECPIFYSKIEENAPDKLDPKATAEKTYRDMSARFTQKGERNWLDNSRDRVRERLTRWNKRGLPVQEFGDMTPTKADVLAKEAMKLPVPDEAPKSFSQLKDELSDLLDQAESFPDRYQKYLADTAQKSARLQAMENAVLPNGANGDRAFKFAVELPNVKIGPDGKAIVTMQKELFDNPSEFKSEMDALRKELGKRLSPVSVTGLKTNPADQMVLDQVATQKKLELYLTQSWKVLTQNPDAKMDPEAQKLYDRIMALYKTDVPQDFDKLDPKVKELYDQLVARYGKDGAPKPSLLGALNGKWSDQQHLPYWAWRDLRWKQLWVEIETLYKNEAPKGEGVLNWMKKLSPEERRMLGISNLADSVGFWSENKWFRALSLFGGPLAGGGFSLKEFGPSAYEWYFKDDTEKEKCAGKSDDKGFSNCMLKYLEAKYTAKQLHELIFDKKSLLDDAGSISDPKVRGEVEDAIARRQKAREMKGREEESADALAKGIQNIVNEKDVTSSSYRDAIVTTKGDGPFLLGLMGAGEKPGRLATLFPGEFNANRTAVETILKETDGDKRTAELETLKKAGAEKLADDLKDILSDRQDFLDGKFKKKNRGGGKKNDEEEDN